jgi:hypothetical protein
MRPMRVVMTHEGRHRVFEMLLVQNQQPVEALCPNRRTKRSATPFAWGARYGVRTISIPSVRNTSSKLA